MNEPAPGTSLRDDARRIARLAGPLFAGQLAVLAFSTVDTLLMARTTPQDLAALAIGAAAYASVFVGLMGVVMAVAPIAAQAFGAGRLADCGAQLAQAQWIALALAVPGGALLLFPAPVLALTQAEPDVAGKLREYLAALAFALPAALLFAAQRGFHNGIGRPRAVMLMQFGALALKIPLSALLAFGWTLPAAPGLVVLPPLGVAGCGWATAIVMWLQCLAAWLLVKRDPYYAAFGLQRSGLVAPRRALLTAQLRLGVPMGLAILVEVTGFTFMALFIARLGATPVAGHQIAANVTGLLFMMPLAIAHAGSSLVARQVGAADPAGARRLGWHTIGLAGGLSVAVGVLLLAANPLLVRAYTPDAEVAAVAAPLLRWVALFHVFDALQIVTASVLRAHRVATRPLVIYAVSIWGVGLGGGCLIGLDLSGHTPPALQGAAGFWLAATVGLALAAACLTGFLAWMLRRQAHRAGPGAAPVRRPAG